MILPDITSFINQNIIERDESLFTQDLKKNERTMKAEIKDKKVLVIGGAGTIGSSFIRALVNYNPSSLVVVDTNENGINKEVIVVEKDKLFLRGLL